MYSRRSPGTAALCGLEPAGASGPCLVGMARPDAAGHTGGYSGPGTLCIPAMSMTVTLEEVLRGKRGPSTLCIPTVSTARARNRAQRRAVVPAPSHIPGIGARGTVRSGGRAKVGGGTAQ